METDNLIRKPFEPKLLEEERDKNSIVMPLRLNSQEQQEVKEAMLLFNQPKDSTALKILAHIGYLDVIHNEKSAYILNAVKGNLRKNKRTGISEIDVQM